jgi:hypothetical protein
VEFYSKNKFEKLVHLVGFIIRTLLFCYSSGLDMGPSAVANLTEAIMLVFLAITVQILFARPAKRLWE